MPKNNAEQCDQTDEYDLEDLWRDYQTGRNRSIKA